jgi:hypothetical protein
VGDCGQSPQDGKLYNFYESMLAGGPKETQRCRFMDVARPGKANLYTVHRRLFLATDIDETITGPSRHDDRWTTGPLPGPFIVQHVCHPDHRLGC